MQALAAGWRDDPATMPWLRERATTDQDEDVRRAAVQALAAGWRDDPATMPWLRECATTDQDEDVAGPRCRRWPRAGAMTRPPCPVPLRERATTDQHAAVRRAAVQALAAGWRDDPATMPWLRERATTDQH